MALVSLQRRRLTPPRPTLHLPPRIVTSALPRPSLFAAARPWLKLRCLAAPLLALRQRRPCPRRLPRLASLTGSASALSLLRLSLPPPRAPPRQMRQAAPRRPALRPSPADLGLGRAPLLLALVAPPAEPPLRSTAKLSLRYLGLGRVLLLLALVAPPEISLLYLGLGRVPLLLALVAPPAEPLRRSTA